MIKAFKTQIYPTKLQKEYFEKAFGIRRFVWNYGLNNYLESLNNGIYKTNYDIQKEINNTLCKDNNYLWLNDVNSMVRQESLKDLGLSIKKYHEQQKKARRSAMSIPCEKYKPRFKSKKHDTKSFRYNNKSNPVVPINKKHFYLTTVKSKKNRLCIKTAESIMFLKSDDTRFCSITIKMEGNKYYMIIIYEKTNHRVTNINNTSSIGIDMGMKTPLTCYDSNNKSIKYHYPDKLKKQEKHTEHLHHLLSRKKYGSNRYNKCKILLEKSYQKENNIKKEFREQITAFLCKNYHTIKIEDFNTKINTLRNINRALCRLGKYAFIERLKNKSELYGNDLVFIKNFPTTQTCSKCGNRKFNNDKLTLNDRTYKCDVCGNIVDRDINAAINILNA